MLLKIILHRGCQVAQSTENTSFKPRVPKVDSQVMKERRKERATTCCLMISAGATAAVSPLPQLSKCPINTFLLPKPGRHQVKFLL